MKYKVFVDGHVGTTGLGIFNYLKKRDDVLIMPVDEKKRKDLDYRCAMVSESDITFLCLPENASRELVEALDLLSLEKNNKRLIDSSTAFRVHPNWVYGLPEISHAQRKLVQSAFRIAVPGCHASAFILSVRPLVDHAVISTDYPVVASSITGYSGGGKQMIAQYQNFFTSHDQDKTMAFSSPSDKDCVLDSPRLYGLGLKHKHLPEMKHFTKLTLPPVFMPAVAAYFKGLAVTTYWHLHCFKTKMTLVDLQNLYNDVYRDEVFVKVDVLSPEQWPNFYEIQKENNSNRVNISVFGNDDHAIVVTRLDNLGKGAAGAAIQCLNLSLGLDETLGL